MQGEHHFRNSPRPQVAVQVEVHRQDDSRRKFISYSEDLGKGGLFLAGEYDLVSGEPVRVVLSTPSTWSPLSFQAIVAWVRPAGENQSPGAGLRFVDLSEAQSLALIEFVTSLDYQE